MQLPIFAPLMQKTFFHFIINIFFNYLQALFFNSSFSDFFFVNDSQNL